MRGDFLDEARRWEDDDKAIGRKIEEEIAIRRRLLASAQKVQQWIWENPRQVTMGADVLIEFDVAIADNVKLGEQPK